MIELHRDSDDINGVDDENDGNDENWDGDDDPIYEDPDAQLQPKNQQQQQQHQILNAGYQNTQQQQKNSSFGYQNTQQQQKNSSPGYVDMKQEQKNLSPGYQNTIATVQQQQQHQYEALQTMPGTSKCSTKATPQDHIEKARENDIYEPVPEKEMGYETLTGYSGQNE